MAFRTILLVALVAFVFSGVLRAEDKPVLPQETKDAVLKCDVVFVGEITQIGFVEPGPPNVASYGDVRIKVLQVLHGSVGSQVVIGFDVREGFGVYEIEPKVGSTYIFLAKKNAQGTAEQFTALKLLPATDENIAKVKLLIAQRAKP